MTLEKKESFVRSFVSNTRAQLRTLRWLLAWVGTQLGRRFDRRDPSIEHEAPSERWG